MPSKAKVKGKQSDAPLIGQVVDGELRTVSGDVAPFEEGGSREGWGPGPWDGEPDRVEWKTAAGLPALARRGPMGNWCGYAAVPPGHPCHGKKASEIEEEFPDVSAHGGITYASPCDGPICHVPTPGEPDDVHWIGFDCGHFMDVMPLMEVYMRKVNEDLVAAGKEPLHGWGREKARAFGRHAGEISTYRTIEYVKGECEQLAEQLAALTP